MNKKILNKENIKKIISSLKAKQKKIVLCHGVFDILHVGHINHFEEAKSKGEILVVSVTSDKFVNKGPYRPVFSENFRAKFISSISVVDYVFINDEKTSRNLINIIKPDFYVKGPDYKKNSNDMSGQIKDEKKAVEKNNGKIYYTKGRTFSSSKIINDDLSIIFKNDQIKFLSDLKKIIVLIFLKKLLKK